MDFEVFKKIWAGQGKERCPQQNLAEFWHYLCVVEALHKYKKPGEKLKVVEVGVRYCTQKPFYEAIGARWIGVDTNILEPDRPRDPDLVLGESAAKSTIDKVYKKLGGYPDVVFIDADHRYRHVVRDFLAYFPLVLPTGLLALHDVYTLYHGETQVFLLWEDLVSNWSYRLESIWNHRSNYRNLYGIGLVYMQECDLSYITVAKKVGFDPLLPTDETIAKWKQECAKREIP